MISAKNYCLIFSSSLIYYWNVKIQVLYTEFNVTHVWPPKYVIRVWPLKTLHNYCKSLIFFRCLLNKTEIYFDKVSTNIK